MTLDFIFCSTILFRNRVDRVPGFLSSRPNWLPPLPPAQASVAPPPRSVPRGDTLACGRTSGGSQFGRRQTLRYSKCRIIPLRMPHRLQVFEKYLERIWQNIESPLPPTYLLVCLNDEKNKREKKILYLQLIIVDNNRFRVEKKPCGNQQSTKLIEINLYDRHQNSGLAQGQPFLQTILAKRIFLHALAEWEMYVLRDRIRIFL
jgi:hypothetical protein